WSVQVFSLHTDVCEAVTADCLITEYACDFESDCAWTLSDYSGAVDWSVSSPQLLSATARAVYPQTDFSTGNSDGHFLLLNSSKTDGRCDHRVTSPVLMGISEGCRLRVAFYQRNESLGSFLVDPWKLLWTPVGPVDEPVQLSLEYRSCLGVENGAVALDSIQLQNCFPGSSRECSNLSGCIDKFKVCDFHPDCRGGEDEGTVCGLLPRGAHCSFEDDLCGWFTEGNVTSWTLVSSGTILDTSSPLLGSTLAATGGHFLYLRAEQGRGYATAQSPLLPPTAAAQDCQVQFSVYIYGLYNGTVSLYVEENSMLGKAPLMWEQAGGWMDRWLMVALHLFRLKLHAAWESSSATDIALDNITFGGTCFFPDATPREGHYTNSCCCCCSLTLIHCLVIIDYSDVMWLFTSCGASGPHGPTQAQCNNAYRRTNMSVLLGTKGPLQGVQTWQIPVTSKYIVSAYGAAGGKGAKNTNRRSHGVFISAIFHFEKGDNLYILVGQKGEDACPGKNPVTQKICLGESSIIEDDDHANDEMLQWAGGGGGGGGATYIFRMVKGAPELLLVAAGGGGKAYMEDPNSSMDDTLLEQYENDTLAPGVNGRIGAAGGGGGWNDVTKLPWAGKSLTEGAEGGSACPQALEKLYWATHGGFGGGGGACTAGGGGGGYRGGDAAEVDELMADGLDGISFINPVGEIYIHPLAAMESHGEVDIRIHINCSHCEMDHCKRDLDSKQIQCLCENGKVLASDNVTCTGKEHIASTVSLHYRLLLFFIPPSAVYYRKNNQLQAVRAKLQSPEYKLSKIRTSTIMTDYNPNYCFAGKMASLNELKEVPRKHISLLRALGHGAFGEVYEGHVVGIGGESVPLQVAIKTLPEICSEQDEMDFLMEALIISKFNHQNIVRCIGVSLQALPRFILLELMTGGDMKTFLRENRPKTQISTLTMLDLLSMAKDIACGCKYLEDNHFIHRDIAARNCLLACTGASRAAKIGDFGMARDIYRASYYRKGGRAMLPVKWMPPEAFLEGIFTSKTDTWSFGVLLWEILSLGYMPYPCKSNQEVLEFVTSGRRMDPPKNCPGPVYRIMTQCWQHRPEHRPDFGTVLERVNYCTQDPDIINTSLPVEYGPTSEDEGSIMMRPENSNGMAPLLVSSNLTPQLSQISDRLYPNQKVHRPQELPVRDSLSSPMESSTLHPAHSAVLMAGQWLYPDPGHQPLSEPKSQPAQRLTNKPKTLWNHTYGSWVPENFSRSGALGEADEKPPATPEREDSGLDCTSSSSPSSRESRSPGNHYSPSEISRGGPAGKPQTFPCGNVNYAYDDGVQVLPGSADKDGSREKTLPLNKVMHFLCNPEKPARDRDSGLSLSEDLSITPV
uniref:Tyrosine-protein kinase receptor n=1 Tax=Callorhinchus milii TaxID=7868 RepID=A0A4W3KIR6_CALMI